MGIEIHLAGTGSGLILRMEEGARGWCRCFISDRGEHLLGGQPADYVISHLLQALEDPLANPAGEIDGHIVSWVMSLSSPHVSMYSTPVDQDQWLFLQNAEAKIIHVFVLTAEQTELWKSRLQSSSPGMTTER
jgi:hypothetical protein